MDKENQTDIRLSAQRALWGHIPPSLRAFSAELGDSVVRVRAIFDEKITEGDKELLSIANAEIISDYPEPYDINEEFLVIPTGDIMEHLQSLIYLRYESAR